MKIGFDNDKYLRMQSEHIRKRISKFGDKLYLEFGGKPLDDYHAPRMLPGFQPDNELRMSLQLVDQVEIVIAISATDIKKNKICGDLGITHDADVPCLIQAFRDAGLYVDSVVVTRYIDAAGQLKGKLETAGVKIHRHYSIDGHPANVPLIVDEDGYGKDEYIETTRPLVTVTTSGPGSSEITTCSSQLHHESRRGVKAGYAKFGAFPIWNLPLNHLVNLAYEAAIADPNDANMIDPFRLEAYGKTIVNCNRDVEIFPAFSAVPEGIYGNCPYRSSTGMDVNMVGSCIVDDGMCREARRQEIICRWCTTMDCLVKGEPRESEVTKIGFLMKQADVTTANRPTVHAALLKAEVTSAPIAAIELSDGCIITDRTSGLLGTSAAVLLNIVKTLNDIPDETELISPTIIGPVQALKINYPDSKNPCLHTDEILIALSMNAASDLNAAKALEQLRKLYGCQAYTSVIPSEVDIRILNKLGPQPTSEPRYENEKVYH